MEAAQLTSRPTIQVLKEINLSWFVKTSEEKEKKGIKKKNVINALCECNFNAFAEEHFSSKSTCLVILILLLIYND